jgi:hypothetical protein
MAGLTAVGVVIYAIGMLMTAVVAFRRHALWGLACLFVPLAAVIFALLHWSEARNGFFVMIGGLLFGSVIAVQIQHRNRAAAALQAQAEVKSEPASHVVASVAETYTPPPSAYVPPQPPPAPVEAAPEQPMIKQVYADNATHTFYSADCSQRPPNAYRLARSLALKQGFREAPCL